MMMSSERITLILLIYIACLSTTYGQNGTSYPYPPDGSGFNGSASFNVSDGGDQYGPPGGDAYGPPGGDHYGPPGGGLHGPPSPMLIQRFKEQCKQLKNQMIDQFISAQSGQESAQRAGGAGRQPPQQGTTTSRAEIEQSAEFQSAYPQECKEADSFTYRNLSREEAMGMLYMSLNDPRGIYTIAREISEEMLREIIFNASKMAWGVHGSPMQGALQAIVDTYIKRLGGLRSVTTEQLSFLGSTIVYAIPTHNLDQMSREVIDSILEYMTTATVASFNPMPMEGGDPHGLPPYDIAASLASLIMDVGRVKALCRTVWRYYRNIPDDRTFNKTWILLFCAPQRVCRSLSADIIQNNRDVLVGFPLWKCHPGNIEAGNFTEHYENFIRSFPGLAICGRHLASSIVGPGPNQLIIDTAEVLMSLGSLSLCLPDEHLMRGVDMVGCPMALEGLSNGIFSQKMEKFVAARCLTIPTNLNDLTCTNITFNFGPLLKYLDHHFWSDLPSGVLCDSVCIEAFKSVELPSDVKSRIMNRCYRDTNVAITSQVVQDLGAMVTKLPIDRLETVSAADLGQTVESIKEDYRATKSKRKRDPRRKAIARTIAKKMASSGDLKAITDSEDMMKTVSLKDLKNAVTANIEEDLGIDEHDVHLSDSQNKWVMRKILKNKQASNFSADDIRSKKSLVKGFLSKDIHRMGEAHNDSGIELAKALCEQTNWPLKPLKAINRDMIKKSLEARNSTHPMTALTEVDVSSIGCECLMHFKSEELMEMDKPICSAVCEKVGYCNNFRCLNNRHKKNFLQACLSCKDLGVNVFTEAEMDELGPNLISQLSGSQVSTLVPSSVLMTQMGSFKEMCMTRDFRATIAAKLMEVYGSGIDYDTLTMLGSGAMMFPEAALQNMNLSYVAELAETFVSEISPTDEVLVKLQQCCERWLQTDDITHYNELKQNLLIAVKDAIIDKMQNPSARKKRQVVSWTCENVRLVSEAFTTVEDADINNMNTTEFIECLADIGSLTSWSAAQKTLLLAKTESAFGVSVCNLTTTDLLNMGEIGEAMSTSQISCLPLDEDDIVASFGDMPAWTTDQLGAFATRYLSVRGLSYIFGFTPSDISLVGHLLCGFTPVQLAAIPAATIGASGSQLGSLSHCPISQLVSLKTVAIDPIAYGPIVNWTAAEVGELKHVLDVFLMYDIAKLAGLVGTEIQDLSVDALEGLSSEVIPRIPVNTLKEMTVSQLEALTDIQAVTITADQKAAMSADQIAILGEVTTDGEEKEPEVTAAPPSTGSIPDVQSALLLLGTVLIMLLLST